MFRPIRVELRMALLPIAMNCGAFGGHEPTFIGRLEGEILTPTRLLRLSHESNIIGSRGISCASLSRAPGHGRAIAKVARWPVVRALTPDSR